MYKYKNDQDWRRFDLSSPSKKSANLMMCQAVQDHLTKEKFYTIPVVNIKDSVSSKDKEKIKEKEDDAHAAWAITKAELDKKAQAEAELRAIDAALAKTRVSAPKPPAPVVAPAAPGVCWCSTPRRYPTAQARMEARCMWTKTASRR